jgi:AcrR family transcriptional regulator
MGNPLSDKREAILQSSAHEIAQSGIRGMRVSKVAANAGVSTALLYYHFTDRAGLLDAALKYMTAQSNFYRSRLDAPGDTSWDRLLNHMAQEFQEDPVVRETTMAWNELRASSVYEPELRKSMSAATAVWRGEIADSIRQIQKDGELPLSVVPEANAVILVALMEGLGWQWICGEISVEDAQSFVRTTAIGLLRE